MKLVDVIEKYCKENDIVLLFGTQAYQNIEADMHNYKDGQLILLLDTSYSIGVYSGAVTNYTYNVTMALGEKFDEDGTEASLQELYIEKYHKRLKKLSDKFNEIIAQIACAGDFNVNSFNIRYDINKFDLNADFIAGTGVIAEIV